MPKYQTRKRCSSCREFLPLAKFNLCSKSEDRKQAMCRRCLKAYLRGYAAGRRRERRELEALAIS